MNRFPSHLERVPEYRGVVLVWVGLAAGLGCVGCDSSPPPRPQAAKPAATAHAVHDHAGHDHAGHDHPKQNQALPGGAGEVGHGEAAGHEEHEHPVSLAAGIARFESTWAAVKSALAAGEHDKADEGVHEVGHLLEEFEALLVKEKPAAGAEAAGKKAIEEIFACFDTLDTAVHEGAEALKKIDVEALGGRVSDAVKTLKEIAR